MPLGESNDRNGARPVKIRQAGAVPGSVPQRSPPSAIGGPFNSSRGARGRGRKATGQRTTKAKDNPNINIMHWNAEGVTNKKTELEQFLHQNSINICCIQETHLQKEKPFKIRGYQTFRSDRQGRKKGGVLTLVRNNMNASETKRYMDEAEYIEVKSGFLIAGDFNSQSQSWGYNILDKRGEDIETWQDENHLILVNDPTDPPTFYSRRWHTTKPDLALCTDDIHKNLSRKVLDQLGGSDHRPVLLTITRCTTPEPPQHARWNHKKAQWGLFRIRTNELTKDIKVEGLNINNVVKDFNASIIKAAKEIIPRGVRKDYTPYWTAELQRAHDDLTKAREEAETNPS
ncbi:hypothetical protein C0Q70_15357 [Pomacea canaliculata]|uniref:Endonuclease/exonuclease/phosphatase domain-containing protein n=1 Tax=Pomacea canaliculata TaxID=400727 RepID=A0A2T7NUK6_POMCA|nr:hypothetical protein C0Q70_15357 [Pomacea canaliculata]